MFVLLCRMKCLLASMLHFQVLIYSGTSIYDTGGTALAKCVLLEFRVLVFILPVRCSTPVDLF